VEIVPRLVKEYSERTGLRTFGIIVCEEFLTTCWFSGETTGCGGGVDNQKNSGLLSTLAECLTCVSVKLLDSVKFLPE